jgi:hypothetical protein
LFLKLQFAHQNCMRTIWRTLKTCSKITSVFDSVRNLCLTWGDFMPLLAIENKIDKCYQESASLCEVFKTRKSLEESPVVVNMLKPTLFTCHAKHNYFCHNYIFLTIYMRHSTMSKPTCFTKTHSSHAKTNVFGFDTFQWYRKQRCNQNPFHTSVKQCFWQWPLVTLLRWHHVWHHDTVTPRI